VTAYDLTKLRDDEVVFHFGGRLNEVDAYTFANTLLALVDGLRAVNQQINPGFGIDIRIDALGGGSFRASPEDPQEEAISPSRVGCHQHRCASVCRNDAGTLD
jgi:hypothetical protein